MTVPLAIKSGAATDGFKSVSYQFIHRYSVYLRQLIYHIEPEHAIAGPLVQILPLRPKSDSCAEQITTKSSEAFLPPKRKKWAPRWPIDRREARFDA